MAANPPQNFQNLQGILWLEKFFPKAVKGNSVQSPSQYQCGLWPMGFALSLPRNGYHPTPTTLTQDHIKGEGKGPPHHPLHHCHLWPLFLVSSLTGQGPGLALLHTPSIDWVLVELNVCGVNECTSQRSTRQINWIQSNLRLLESSPSPLGKHSSLEELGRFAFQFLYTLELSYRVTWQQSQNNGAM